MKNNRMLQIVIGMLLLVVIIFLTYAIFFKKELVFSKSDDPTLVNFDTITTNVQGGDYNFLKMDVSLKALDKSQAKMIKNNQAQIRRLILNISSAQDGKSLLQEVNKQRFKTQIKNNIKQNFKLDVTDVYFRDFVMAD